MNRWWKIWLIACFSMCFSVNNLSAQEAWEQIIEQLVDNNEEISTSHWQNLMEDLAELKEHPININTATKEQLERFPFLSDQLIENILYYPRSVASTSSPSARRVPMNTAARP